VTEHLQAAEAAVVGACLRSGRAVDESAQILRAGDFSDPDMAALFQACVTVRADHPRGDVDHLLVATTAGTFKLTTPADLQRLAREVPSTANVGFYARYVADAATVRRYAQAASAVLASVEAGNDAQTVTQRALNAMQAAASDHRVDGLHARDYDELMDEQDAPYDWIVPGFIERGDRFVLTGHEGLGKSTLLRQAAILTAGGFNFVTGKPLEDVEPGRVLVVDVENSEKQWRRKTSGMRLQVKTKGGAFDGRLKVACHGRINLTSAEDSASVHRLIDLHQPDLVVIGPLYKLVPGGITNDDDAAPLITALDKIRDRGIALMLETHMGHSTSGGPGGARNVRPRGSSQLMGWPEFGYGLAPATSDASEGEPIPGLVDMIAWRGDRDERKWPDQWNRGSIWPWEPW
jgi:hypothetical protein